MMKERPKIGQLVVVGLPGRWAEALGKKTDLCEVVSTPGQFLCVRTLVEINGSRREFLATVAEVLDPKEST